MLVVVFVFVLTVVVLDTIGEKQLDKEQMAIKAIEEDKDDLEELLLKLLEEDEE